MTTGGRVWRYPDFWDFVYVKSGCAFSVIEKLRNWFSDFFPLVAPGKTANSFRERFREKQENKVGQVLRKNTSVYVRRNMQTLAEAGLGGRHESAVPGSRHEKVVPATPELKKKFSRRHGKFSQHT